MDKAGKAYWDGVWSGTAVPDPVDPRVPGLNNHVNHQFHAKFVDLFSGLPDAELSLIEIGCARSAWLPYFAREFRFSVSGLDYSSHGCEQARAVMEQAGVPGEVLCADLFAPPPEYVEAFDIVVSFGVVEHFQETGDCVEHLARFAKPGGIMVTVIPNMVGWNGILQRQLNQEVFEMHVPLTASGLARAHRGAGLDVMWCDYFLDASLGVVNIENRREQLSYRLLTRAQSWVSKAVWIAARAFPVRPNRWSSPYVWCASRKPWN